jgi:hypothetical protein
VLLEGGGRQPIGLGRVEIVADVERADVLHTVLAAVLQEERVVAGRRCDRKDSMGVRTRRVA